MSEKKWNPEQLKAIESTGGTLLVSAAAGSGKTAVLVERVIRLMTDDKNPTDADRLLVVTFTEAAAAEMKMRISAALSKLSAERPEDTRLSHQLILMDNAHISTIDSFCLNLVSENFSAAGVLPDFRIADESELGVISEEAMEEALEKFYQSGDPDFSELCETLSGGRDDKALGEDAIKLYDFIRALPHYREWLSEKLSDYETDLPVNETVWGKGIIEHARRILEHDISSLEKVRVACEEDEIVKKYYDVLGMDKTDSENLLADLEGGWDYFRKALLLTKPERLPTIRNYESQMKEFVKSVRNSHKDALSRMNELFSEDEEEFRDDIKGLYPIIRSFFELTLEYDRLYLEKLHEKSMEDFPDIEHLTLELLSEKDGNGDYIPTRLAKNISSRFDYILIDECQDINFVQDTVFKAVSTGDNLFYVGDVKQSIYRFRQAMPELFIEKRKEWPLFDGENYPAAIILGRNYRSRKNIADAVNFVFGRIMSVEAAEMDYGEEEKLIPAAVFPESDEIRNEFMLIDTSGEDSVSAEAAAVAEKISEMLKSGATVSEGDSLRKIQCSDICIILRAMKGIDTKFISALREKGIPCRSDHGEGFLSLPETAAVLNMLKAADNPLLDIPMAGAMLSEMFLFSADELAEIRAAERHLPLCSAVTKAAEGGNEKAAAFLKVLAALRKAAATETSDSVIERLYSETAFPQIMRACPGGEVRLANLRRLVKYAAEREEAGWHGLAGFLRFIAKLEERGSDLKPAGYSGTSDNCVKIMTVHHSKGLEFPVVFICRTGGTFRRDTDRIKIHSTLGFASPIRDKATGAIFKTVPSEAIRIECERQRIAEEMRCLYVAMTRAKENLIITCGSKNPMKLLANSALKINSKDMADPFCMGTATCEADFLLPALLCHPDAAVFRTFACLTDIVEGEDESRWNFSLVSGETSAGEEKEEAAEEKAEPDLLLEKALISRKEWKYPFAAAEKIPVKAGVSELTHQEIREKLLFSASLHEGSLSGAERGTALHTFMQFCDFAAAKENPEAEILRMTQKSFITEKQAKAIDPEKVKGFFGSALYSEIEAADGLYRELRFLQPLPASELGYENAAPEDKITVQGVADCVYVKDGKFTVVDYKTDYVEDIDELSLRYASQLLMYRRLLEKSLGMPCRGCVIWSFRFGKELWIK